MIIPCKAKPDYTRTVNGVLGEMVAEIPLWIRPRAPQVEKKIDFRLSKPSCEAGRVAELIGKQEIGDEIDATTHHALLVVLGYFAQALGLIAKLESVPLQQKQGSLRVEGAEEGEKKTSQPQTKLIEFLVGILGGIEYLQDLNRSENPIAKDPTVAEAWAQAIFAHYSGVSRTLDASDEETLAAVIEVLRDVSRPFIKAAVMEAIKHQGCLTVDVDLGGRPVSPTSTDYPDASFGWMDDDVSKGYQDAIASLVCEQWTRLLLILQRYTGRTHSAECLQAMVKEIEQVLGVRPRRRVELVQARRDDLSKRLEAVQEALERTHHTENKQWNQIRQMKTDLQAWQTQVEMLDTAYRAQGRPERPYSQLAKARRQLAAAQKREQRTWRALSKKQRQRDDHQCQLDRLQDELLALDEWLAHLETDNQANPNPVPIVLRVDAGFSTGPNLAWLIEMGYSVLTKAHHSGTADSLRKRSAPQAVWGRVGRNAEALNMGGYFQNDCPYPLQAMLVRYYLPDELRYTALLYYDDTPPPPLSEWFARYNARQIIEAGIKEEKSVFTLKRHLVRSPIGMQLQEQFALFGANFVRWAATWIKDMLHQANRSFTTALDQVKTLVRTASRARARWVRNALGHTLIFDENGPFAGTVIGLSGQVAVQLVLSLFNFALS
jgi:hypothetical protein